MRHVTKKIKAPFKRRDYQYKQICFFGAIALSSFMLIGVRSIEEIFEIFLFFWCIYGWFRLSFAISSAPSIRADIKKVGERAGLEYVGKVMVNNTDVFFFNLDGRAVVVCEWMPFFKSDPLLWHIANVMLGGVGVLPIAFVREGSGILLVPGAEYDDFEEVVTEEVLNLPPAPEETWRLIRELIEREKIVLKEIEVPVEPEEKYAVMYGEGIDKTTLWVLTFAPTVLVLISVFWSISANSRRW